jgi:tartrate-resistant acid phosphatase type 5
MFFHSSSTIFTFISFFFFLSFVQCKKEVLIPPSGIQVHVAADSILFAAIGDFGDNSSSEAQVSHLISNLNPDFIISLGDNNYDKGSSTTIVQNIGNYYGDFIYNFDAPSEWQCLGNASVAQQNRFFPCPGNHDYAGSQELLPYLNYFTLPGNEVYYHFSWGPVNFYSLDSNRDIDEQEQWLEQQLAMNSNSYHVVFFHHPPYSTGDHGNQEFMQWDFDGVDLVLSGHDHIYERHLPLTLPNPVYIVNGLGGKSKRTCYETSLETNAFSSFCYDDNYGALLISANSNSMKVQFVNIDGLVIDEIVIPN